MKSVILLASVFILIVSCSSDRLIYLVIDYTFNKPMGYQVSNLPAFSNTRGVETLIQQDGRIVVLGSAYNSLNDDIIILRFEADGMADQTFGKRGVFLYNGLGNNNDRGLGLAIQQDGKILATGYTLTHSGQQRELILLRINTDGTLDSSFGQDGVVTFKGQGTTIGFAVSVQKDGKIIVVGETARGANQDVLVLRYLTNGLLDMSFGNGGAVFFNGSSDSNDKGFDVAIQRDNKIIITGSAGSGTRQDILVLRLLTDGVLDKSFANSGVFTYQFYNSVNSYGNKVVVREDGSILIAGAIGIDRDYDIFVLLLTPDGNIEHSFGEGGVFTFKSNNDGWDYAWGLAIDHNGRILLSGATSGENAAISMLVVRLTGFGALDKSFNGTGFFTYGFSGFKETYGYAITMQQDGRIVVTGSMKEGVKEELFVMRLNG